MAERNRCYPLCGPSGSRRGRSLGVGRGRSIDDLVCPLLLLLLLEIPEGQPFLYARDQRGALSDGAIQQGNCSRDAFTGRVYRTLFSARISVEATSGRIVNRRGCVLDTRRALRCGPLRGYGRFVCGGLARAVFEAD